jgi:hypothetical protein
MTIKIITPVPNAVIGGIRFRRTDK